MGFTKNGDLELNQAQTSRRRFLARNVLAMGAIVATSAVAKAAAFSRPQRQPGSQCFLKGTKSVPPRANARSKIWRSASCCQRCSGECAEFSGSRVMPTRRVIPPSHGNGTPCRFASPVALAPGVPYADLFVTSGHALFIDEVLVRAGELINGTTITLYAADEFDELEFFNIKLEAHDVICAEGAQCETHLTVEETASNFAEYHRLYGAPNAEEVCCAPLLYYKGRRGRQIKSRLRIAISPWFDFREKLDVIRDRLEERGISLCEQMASLS